MADPLSSGSPVAAVRRLGRAARACQVVFRQTALGPASLLLPNAR